MEGKRDYQKAFKEYEKELGFMTQEQFNASMDSIKGLWIKYAELERNKTRVIAEIVELKGCCAAYYKVGDKLVFTAIGMFLPEESTAKIACAWLIRNLIPIFAANEALLSHGVPLKPMLNFTMEPCPDPGPPTGAGTVKCKIYVQ